MLTQVDNKNQSKGEVAKTSPMVTGINTAHGIIRITKISVCLLRSIKMLRKVN